MTDLLIASQVLLWIAVLGLGAVLFALTRQVGVLFSRVAPAGALMVNSVVKAGTAAPRLEVDGLDGASIKIGGSRTMPLLLFFLSPDCPICKQLLPALTSIAADEGAELVIASDGGTADEHKRLRREHGLNATPYVLSEALGRAYGVLKLPYAVLIDSQGTIASLGIVNTREHIESLFTALELGVSSVQEFVHRGS